MYTFTGGQLKVADRKYSTLKSDYEITFNSHSEIKPVLGEDTSAIKNVQYHFVKIKDLANSANNATVDVLCVVKSVGECTELVSQKLGGKVMHKRDLTVYDDSGCECRLTLWNEKAVGDAAWAQNSPILAMKAVAVKDYNGKNLSMGNQSTFEINPDIPAAHELFRFKSSGDVVATLQSMSSSGTGGSSDSFEKRKDISAIRDESLGMGEKPDYASIKGTVNYIKHDTDCWYTACPTEGCNKKVSESMGRWSCEKCMKDFPSCNRRFILSMTMADPSGSFWFTAFNDTAQTMLGKSAEELHEMKSAGDEAGYEAVFKQSLFKSYIVKVSFVLYSPN